MLLYAGSYILDEMLQSDSQNRQIKKSRIRVSDAKPANPPHIQCASMTS